MAYPQVTFVNTTLHRGTLISGRRAAAFENTATYQLHVWKETGRYDAFKLGWHQIYDEKPDVWPVPKHLFWDSDVAKWIEGACYLLQTSPQPELRDAVDELVEMIRGAQQPDGYLNIHFTVVEPMKRFTNLRDLHELYNCGHLIEAALAHQQLTQTDRLMEPLLRYVSLLCDTFGNGKGKIPGYPGHPEIELALLRLFDRTKDPKHQELANFFISERGNPHGWLGKNYYDVEALRRGDEAGRRPAYQPHEDSLRYYQAHRPIVEQETIEGHSVRAMYLLTSVADLVRQKRPGSTEKLDAAVHRLWNNMVQKKMYVTGGIGSMTQWEGFGIDYFLPQGTDDGGCYCETCAAIGVMMLAERMLQTDLNSEYADIMELCLYNAVLTAMSYYGKKFTYINQLASSDHDLSKREEWFVCACCPPNILRILGQISGYIWSYKLANKTVEINTHLYISSTLRIDQDDIQFELQQQTDWPWKGDVKFSLRCAKDITVNLRLRIPRWAGSNWKISPNLPDVNISSGYLSLPAAWLAENPTFTLSLPLQCRLESPHPFTNQNTLSIVRGPIVYCVEDVDNEWVKDHFKTVQLDPECKITEQEHDDPATGERYVKVVVRDGACIVEAKEMGDGCPAVATEKLLRSAGRKIEELHFLPYYARANTGGSGQMRVGLRYWYRS